VAVQLVIALVLGVIAIAVALFFERRPRTRGNRRGAPAAAKIGAVPAQLDRADFPRPDAPWLVVVFSSHTCDGCVSMEQKVAPLEADAVATCNVEYATDRELHERYGIDAVPLVVMADHEGVVRRSFLGVVGATELWDAMAELRAS
jgi:hypothetical protein